MAQHRRSSGKIHFLQVRDGTGICQCVATLNDLGAEAFAAANHLSQETSLQVTGIVREDKRAPGGYELTAKSFHVSAPPVTIRLRRRSMALRFCTTCGICGFGEHPDRAVREAIYCADRERDDECEVESVHRLGEVP